MIAPTSKRAIPRSILFKSFILMECLIRFSNSCGIKYTNCWGFGVVVSRFHGTTVTTRPTHCETATPGHRETEIP